MKKSKFTYFLEKEKKIVFSGLLLGVGLLGLYLGVFYVPMFHSSIKLYIRNVPKDNVLAAYGGGSVVRSESGYSNPLFNYMEILQSQRLAERVYEILKTHRKYRDDLDNLSVDSKDRWFKVYSKMLKTKVVPSTDIIKVAFEWDNADTAQNVLGLAADEFKKLNMEIRRDTELKRREYLEEQYNNISQQLFTIREQIKDFKLKNQTIDIANESSELTKARVELEKEAQLLRSQVSFSQTKLNDISKQLGMRNAQAALKAASIGVDPYLVKLSQDLAIAQQKYAKMTVKLTDLHPDAIEVKNEINSLKENIEKRKRETLGNLGSNKGLYDSASVSLVTDMARVQADSLSQRSQLSALQGGINSLKGEESAIPLKKLGLDELEKKEKALVSAYESIIQKLMEAKIKENQVDDNIVVLDAPTEPDFALSELLIKIIAFLAVGALGGLAVAWIKHDIEDKWYDATDIELTTGKKVLGIIPWLQGPHPIGESPMAPYDSVLGIAFANLINSLIARSYLEDAQAISFISTVTPRRNSPIVHNLTATLSRLGKSVVLVDTDFSQPEKLLQLLNIPSPQNAKDLVDITNELNAKLRVTPELEDEFVIRLINEALIEINISTTTQDSQFSDSHCFSYLCASKMKENIHDYVASKGFHRILEVLKAHYEFIFIDTPSKPVIFPEIKTVTDLSDAVVVLSSMNSNRQNLIEVIQEVETANSKVLGIIQREKNTQLERYLTTPQMTAPRG